LVFLEPIIKIYVTTETKNKFLMEKTALITGATSGIGRATAQEFAKQGIRLIICGRRQERLNTLKEALKIFLYLKK